MSHGADPALNATGPALPAMPALGLLFEQMADAVYLLDPVTSNIVWGNRAAWESLGLDVIVSPQFEQNKDELIAQIGFLKD